MSIVTGTGDAGQTGLVGGTRVRKDDVRLGAYGTVDELNSAVSVALATAGVPAHIRDELERISHWLFDLGSDLATPGLGGVGLGRVGAGKAGGKSPLLADHRAEELTQWVHREEAALPPLREFVLPGGSAAAAALHLARTICRRAERCTVTLHATTGDGAAAIIFLNRLSDLLFMYARRANHAAGIADRTWKKNSSS
ncbi:MAG: cob(I)yrinic acid a,c-diamide adenosyltransferase [Planctomycetota bacterium]